MHKNTISVSRYHTPKEKPVAANWDSPQEDPEQQHCKPRLHRAHGMGHHRPNTMHAHKLPLALGRAAAPLPYPGAPSNQGGGMGHSGAPMVDRGRDELSLTLSHNNQTISGRLGNFGGAKVPPSQPPKAPMAFERAAFLSSFESVMCFHIT